MATILPFGHGQVRSFGMPAEFWLRRAKRCRENNMPLRALALLRHAVQLEPDNADLRLEQAFLLRELCCYEASNRAIFELLSRKPAAFTAFSLLAENMLSLGNLSETSAAYEIYARYARMHPEVLPEWDEELYDVEDALASYPQSPRGRQRLSGLYRAVCQRIQRREWDKVKALLDRSAAPPYPRHSAQRDALTALYLQGVGQSKKAERLALRAAAASSRVPGMLLSMSALLFRLKSPKAGPMLMSAALRAASAEEERGVCALAADAGLPWIGESMLRRTLKTAPNRMSALCDLAVFRLRAGDLAEADSLARRLWEIDPEDPDVEMLFQCVEQLKADGGKPDAARSAGLARPFYGAPDPQRLAEGLESCCNLLLTGLDALREALKKNGRFRRQFLELFTLDGNQAMLLPQLAESMEKPEAAALLRRVLLLGGASPLTVQVACDSLRDMGFQPPYLVRAGGRLMITDPAAVPPVTPSFLQRMLFRRLKDIAEACGDDALGWALDVIRHMPVSRKLRLAGDRRHIWTAAFEAAWAKDRGLPPPLLDTGLTSPEERREFTLALRTVRQACKQRT